MGKRDYGDIDYLKKIQYHAQWLTECFSDVNDEQAFINDRRLTDIGSFNVSLIGEYVNNISDDLLKRYPEIPWEQIRGIRNRIVHDYDGVNKFVIWDIIKNDIDPLLETVNRMIDDII